MNKKASLQFLSAMAIFGTLGLFVRHIDTDSVTLSFLRTLIGALILGGIVLITHRPCKIEQGQGKFILLSAVFLACNWIFLFESYRYTAISIATVIYYLAPVMVMIISITILKDSVNRSMITALSLCLIGLICITQNQVGTTSMKGIIFALLAASSYAGVLLSNRKIHRIDRLTFTFLQLSIAAVIIAGYLLVKGELAGMLQIPQPSWPWIIAVGVLHTGLAYSLYFGALQRLPASRAAIFSYLDPGVAILVSLVFLQEGCTGMQAAGILLIISGILMADRK